MRFKLAFILLMPGTTFPSLGQNIQIKVDNTEPRLGQEINLTIETTFFDEFLKATFTDSFEVEETYSNKDLTKTIVAKRLGPMTIGPLSFEFNGMKYLSNSVAINVIPGLPDKEGVWIRKLRMDDKDYIVIEQLSIVVPVKTFSENVFHTEWKPTAENLVRLCSETSEDIEFDDWRSGMGGSPSNTKKYTPGLSYSYRFYEIKKAPDFKGSFRLKQKHFENLPRGTKIPDIVIE